MGMKLLFIYQWNRKKGKKSWLGPQGITTDLSDEEIRRRVEAAIQDVPHAVGMNHHMGSKATEDERVMRIVLEVCKENGLFYLDSKTTGKSVVSKLATEMNVPFLENGLFFDDVYTTEHIKKQAHLLEQKLSEYRTNHCHRSCGSIRANDGQCVKRIHSCFSR